MTTTTDAHAKKKALIKTAREQEKARKANELRQEKLKLHEESKKRVHKFREMVVDAVSFKDPAGPMVQNLAPIDHRQEKLDALEKALREIRRTLESDESKFYQVLLKNKLSLKPTGCRVVDLVKIFATISNAIRGKHATATEGVDTKVLYSQEYTMDFLVDLGLTERQMRELVHYAVKEKGDDMSSRAIDLRMFRPFVQSHEGASRIFDVPSGHNSLATQAVLDNQLFTFKLLHDMGQSRLHHHNVSGRTLLMDLVSLGVQGEFSHDDAPGFLSYIFQRYGDGNSSAAAGERALASYLIEANGCKDIRQAIVDLFRPAEYDSSSAESREYAMAQLVARSSMVSYLKQHGDEPVKQLLKGKSCQMARVESAVSAIDCKDYAMLTELLRLDKQDGFITKFEDRMGDGVLIYGISESQNATEAMKVVDTFWKADPQSVSARNSKGDNICHLVAMKCGDDKFSALGHDRRFRKAFTTKNNRGLTPAQLSLLNPDIKIFLGSIDPITINKKFGSEHKTFAHYAIQGSNTALLFKIKDYEVDLSAHDSYGKPPLFYAVDGNSPDIFMMVLSRADTSLDTVLKIHDAIGDNVVHYCVKHGTPEMLSAILRKVEALGGEGAARDALEANDGQGASPLNAALKAKNAPMLLEMLRTFRGDLDMQLVKRLFLKPDDSGRSFFENLVVTDCDPEIYPILREILKHASPLIGIEDLLDLGLRAVKGSKFGLTGVFWMKPFEAFAQAAALVGADGSADICMAPEPDEDGAFYRVDPLEYMRLTDRDSLIQAVKASVFEALPTVPLYIYSNLLAKAFDREDEGLRTAVQPKYVSIKNAAAANGKKRKAPEDLKPARDVFTKVPRKNTEEARQRGATAQLYEMEEGIRRENQTQRQDTPRGEGAEKPRETKRPEETRRESTANRDQRTALRGRTATAADTARRVRPRNATAARTNAQVVQAMPGEPRTVTRHSAPARETIIRRPERASTEYHEPARGVATRQVNDGLPSNKRTPHTSEEASRALAASKIVAPNPTNSPQPKLPIDEGYEQVLGIPGQTLRSLGGSLEGDEGSKSVVLHSNWVADKPLEAIHVVGQYSQITHPRKTKFNPVDPSRLMAQMLGIDSGLLSDLEHDPQLHTQTRICLARSSGTVKNFGLHEVKSSYSTSQLVESLKVMRDRDPASIHSKNKQGFQPIHIAATYLPKFRISGTRNALKDIVLLGGSLRSRSNDGITPIACACFFDNGTKTLLKVNKEFLSHISPEDICSRTAAGHSLLHFAAANARTDAVSMITKQYSYQNLRGLINAKDVTGRTPLHFAAMNAREDTLATLMSMGGDLLALDNDGRSAMHYALMSKDPREAIERLEGLGAPLDTPDKLGRTPLMYALLMGYPKTVVEKLSTKKSWNQVVHGGCSALSLAVLSPDDAAFDIAMEHCADPTRVDVNMGTARPLTPIGIALVRGDIEKVLKMVDIAVQEGYGKHVPEKVLFQALSLAGQSIDMHTLPDRMKPKRPTLSLERNAYLNMFRGIITAFSKKYSSGACDINAIDQHGDTLLHKAVFSGKGDVFLAITSAYEGRVALSLKNDKRDSVTDIVRVPKGKTLPAAVTPSIKKAYDSYAQRYPESTFGSTSMFLLTPVGFTGFLACSLSKAEHSALMSERFTPLPASLKEVEWLTNLTGSKFRPAVKVPSSALAPRQRYMPTPSRTSNARTTTARTATSRSDAVYTATVPNTGNRTTGAQYAMPRTADSTPNLTETQYMDTPRTDTMRKFDTSALAGVNLTTRGATATFPGASSLGSTNLPAINKTKEIARIGDKIKSLEALPVPTRQPTAF